MAEDTDRKVDSVVGRKPVLKLDLGRRKVRPLPESQSGDSQHLRTAVESMLRPVPSNGSGGLSDRDPISSQAQSDASRTIHIAIVIPDISIFRAIRSSVSIIKPTDLDREVIVHCLLAKKDQDDESNVYAFALTELGLIDPAVAGLSYPEQFELGWSSSNAPINRGPLQ